MGRRSASRRPRTRRAERTGRPSRHEALALPRSSGVLLHVTSLPGGRLGREAYRFVDWLVEAGQSSWQILPLAPPDSFGSPYAGASAFAGWGGLLARPDAPVAARALREFRRRNRYWIDDWLEFTGDARELEAQCRFDREWGALHSYARSHGVRIVGDIPLYVARESADVEAHPEYFELDIAAGVPPDLFSRTGQLWGNPTYRWSAMRNDGFRWWIERFRHALQLVDVTRLDHFRGFVAYWAVRYGAKTAQRGRWRRGPGRALFETVAAELGGLPVIAEDLGHITPPVHRLREALAVPGMHVLQWGFGGVPGHPDQLENHREYSVVYTGTHDNDTARGWWGAAPPAVRSRVEAEAERAGVVSTDPAWTLLELTLSSRSRLAILQAQDVLSLGSEARMNTPSTTEGNWQWRLEPGQLSTADAARLREATQRFGRAAP